MLLGIALCLQEKDVVNDEWPCLDLPQTLASAVADAELVIYRGRVVKNRWGEIGKIVPNVHTVPEGTPNRPDLAMAAE